MRHHSFPFPPCLLDDATAVRASSCTTGIDNGAGRKTRSGLFGSYGDTGCFFFVIFRYYLLQIVLLCFRCASNMMFFNFICKLGRLSKQCSIYYLLVAFSWNIINWERGERESEWRHDLRITAPTIPGIRQRPKNPLREIPAFPKRAVSSSGRR